jgi:hypothetical protein
LGLHLAGELYLDNLNNLATVWVCVATGTPGAWLRLAGVATGAAGGGAMNFPPSPVGIVASGNPSDPGVPLMVGSPQTVPIAFQGDIPLNATGVFGAATVYGSSASGFISVYPAGASVSGG